MRHLLLLLSLSTLSFLTACTPKAATALPQGTMIELGEAAELKPGETTMVEGHNGSFVFLGVTNDSRCPKGVTCISAGEATVSYQVGNATPKTLSIAGDIRTAQRVVSEEVVYNIKGLTPYPKQGKTTEAEDYRLVVTTSLLRD